MQNIFTKGIGKIKTSLENNTKNTTWTPEVHIKLWFLLEHILEGFPLEFYVSFEKQKMFTGNVIGLLLLLMNLRDKVCRPALSTAFAYGLLCLVVRFPIALNKTAILGWWPGGVTMAITAPVTVALIHLHQTNAARVCLASVFPSRIGYHAESPLV